MMLLKMCASLGALACAMSVLLAPPANAADSAELAAFKAAIRAKYDLKERAFANHDAATIVEKFYAPDVVSTDEAGEKRMSGRPPSGPCTRRSSRATRCASSPCTRT
jgi:hypothetical protein